MNVNGGSGPHRQRSMPEILQAVLELNGWQAELIRAAIRISGRRKTAAKTKAGQRRGARRGTGPAEGQ